MHELTDEQLAIQLREAIDSQALSLGTADAAERVARARARAAGRAGLRVSATTGLAAAVVVALVVGMGYAAWRSNTQGGPTGTVGENACSTVPATVGPASASDTAAPGVGHGKFTVTGSLFYGPRTQQTATLLCDGRVLIAGGSNVHGGLTSAELYDPNTGRFSPTGSMVSEHLAGTVTRLSDGRVLVAGGAQDTQNCGACEPVASAELYDPATGSFSWTGSMSRARVAATATLLLDGRVLVAGGYDIGPTYDSAAANIALASAELYDPATGKFSPTGSMGGGRAGATATMLQDGHVLIAGGMTNTVYPTAELYDPVTGKFSPTGEMEPLMAQDTATLLRDGRVLIAGGLPIDGPTTGPAELYDPQTGKFSATGSLIVPREEGCAAALLPDGRVLITGGLAPVGSTVLSSAELYDPMSGTFNPAGSMISSRDDHTATLLTDGRVLLVGGYGGDNGSGPFNYPSAAELYQP
jgi:hypothetical protein